MSLLSLEEYLKDNLMNDSSHNCELLLKAIMPSGGQSVWLLLAEALNSPQ